MQWRAIVADGTSSQSDWGQRTPAQVTTVMALTAHAHQTALILAPSMPDGLTIAHIPLVRAIFEATITLVWCDEVADGANALINDGARQRSNLQSSLRNTRSLAGLAEEVTTYSSRLPTSSSESAKMMEKRCAEVDLDGAYAYYRMLSSMSHASTTTIDAYLDDSSFRDGQPISVMTNPGPLTSSASWSHLVAACLVWSGRVADYLDRERTRRDVLRGYARRLGIPDVLRVDYRAHRRGSNERKSSAGDQ